VLPSKPSLGTFNYFTYYNGNSGVNRQFPIAGQIDLNVDATAYADSLGAFWVSPLKVFGAYYAPGVALPLVWTDITAQVRAPGGRTASRSESVGGLGDVEFWPVALSWSAWKGDLHVDFFGGIYAPTGDFQRNQLANQGLGYWTFEPGVLDRYANCDGVFVLVCSGGLEADGVKKLIEIVCNLLIEPIQLSSFVVREFGVSPVRLE
jgi:hypothetical protein